MLRYKKQPKGMFKQDGMKFVRLFAYYIFGSIFKYKFNF